MKNKLTNKFRKVAKIGGITLASLYASWVFTEGSLTAGRIMYTDIFRKPTTEWKKDTLNALISHYEDSNILNKALHLGENLVFRYELHRMDKN